MIEFSPFIGTVYVQKQLYVCMPNYTKCKHFSTIWRHFDFALYCLWRKTDKSWFYFDLTSKAWTIISILPKNKTNRNFRAPFSYIFYHGIPSTKFLPSPMFTVTFPGTTKTEGVNAHVCIVRIFFWLRGRITFCIWITVNCRLQTIWATRSLISTFVFRCLDSIISLVSISEISSL